MRGHIEATTGARLASIRPAEAGWIDRGVSSLPAVPAGAAGRAAVGPRPALLGLVDA